MKNHPSKSLALAILAFCALLLPGISAYGQQMCKIPTVAEQNAVNPRIYEQVFANPPVSYGLMYLHEVPPGYSIASGVPYQGWCIDSYASISNGGTYFPLIYNSLDTAALTTAGITIANWDKINYIINHKPMGATASDIQVAIWHYIGGGGPSDVELQNGPGQGGFVQANAAVTATIIASAEANAGFVPGPGELVAIVLDLPPSLNGDRAFQPFIIEVKCPSGTIGDFVWNDLNANGIQEPGEPGIDGVTVTLKDGNGVLIDTKLTASNGFYQFTGLSSGTYLVTVVTASPALSGLTASPVASASSTPDTDSNPNPATVVLATDSSSDQTIDFGFYALLPSSGVIGNYVWKDSNQNGMQDASEPGINGVTVTLKDGSNNIVAMTTTAGYGGYLFSGLSAGTYSVEVDTNSPALAGCIPTVPNAPGSNPENDSNQNPSIIVLASNSSVNSTVDFGYISAPVGSIGDYVWKDVNGDGIQGTEADEPGIPNVTIRLYGPGNVLLDTTMTDSDGLYLFTGLTAGTYIVVLDNASPSLAGCVPTTPNAAGSTPTNDSNPNPTTVILPFNDSNNTSIDFGYTPIPTGCIGNFVWKDLNGNGIQEVGEPGINGVTVTLKDGNGVGLATTVTAGNGAYLFTGLAAGNYIVQLDEADTDVSGLVRTIVNAPASATGNDSNPNPAMVNLATNSSSDLTIDFGFIPPGCGCIGNRVWKDLDCDGIQDCNEPGIKGVTVKIYWNGILINTDVTDSCGNYQFCGLWAGCYSVVIDNSQAALSGLVPTLVGAGSSRSYDSNANPATVCLATNKSCDSSIDFGYKKTVSSGSLTTYTMGGWGAVPSGNNPGAFLANHFASVYPGGLTVGGCYKLKFTSAKAIENFLPCGGTASALRHSYVNPTTTLGVLAGQVVALRLGVDFSTAGVTATGLVSAKFKSGKFAGKTVGQVLGLAESALGGAALPWGVSYSDLSSACALVNENYDAGTNKGNLIP